MMSDLLQPVSASRASAAMFAARPDVAQRRIDDAGGILPGSIRPVLRGLATDVGRDLGQGPDQGMEIARAEPKVRKPDLGRVLRDDQVGDDTMIEYKPKAGGWRFELPFVGARTMTRTEGELLDKLTFHRGTNGLREFARITSNDDQNPGLAYRTADAFYPQIDAKGRPVAGVDDGHNDAFRHTYWNALMTRRFGEDFAAAFATAHEGTPGNPADREAMDLFNNRLGRRIARENPTASDDQLAHLVHQAVIRGDAVVIDGNNDLAFSNQVAVGATGSADDPAANGVIAVPAYDPSSR